MPSRQISDLDPRIQSLCVQFIAICTGDAVFRAQKAEVFITCTYRSNLEQSKLYAQGRTVSGRIVTNADAGQSAHNCTNGTTPAARAFDFAIRLSDGTIDWNAQDALWKRAISIGQGLGLQSGVSWGDSAHMQLKDWRE